MRSDFERALRIFADFTNDGFSFEVPTNIFFDKCSEVLVGEVDDTINAMIIEQLIAFDYIDPIDGHVVTLQEKGIKELRRIYNLPPEVANSDASQLQQEFASLKMLINNSKTTSEQLKKIYNDTIDEIQTCHEHNCNNAAIAMTGKLLEIFVTDLLTKNKIKIEPKDYNKNGYPDNKRNELTLKELIDLTKSLPKDTDIVDMDIDLLNVIRRFRNGSVHYFNLKEEPTDKPFSVVVAFCLYTVRKYFKD
jgi:hypothetical protein